MIRLDPRTKLLMLLLVVLYTAIASSLASECVVIMVIMITGIILGRVRRSVRSAIIFYLLYGFACYILPNLGGVLHTSLVAWFALIFKCYPCCMLASIIMGTTHISEFIAGMSKMRIPREVIIPLAIMFRYFPVVKEDWSYIKDAMALRGITLAPFGLFRNPSAVIDALYVPMLVSASKTTDELSVAAVTRGIENPNPRSSRLKIAFGGTDFIFMAVYVALVIFGVMV